MRLSNPMQLRRGATAVEMALVLGVVFLLLFGILEYSRYLMMLQLVDNACREGSRAAAVSTNTNTTANIQAIVQTYLANNGASLTGPGGVPFNPATHIQVFKCDPNNGTPLDASNNPTTWGLADFTKTSFGQGIAVKIDGTYKPITSNLLFMGSTLPLKGTSIVLSEAN